MMERLTNSDKEIPTLVDNEKYWLQVYFKLKDIEDLEEQGLLLRLQCKVGDTIYHIWNVNDKPEIQEIKIATLTNLVAHIENGNFGKYIFLTKAEAEKKLKEMESK